MNNNAIFQAYRKYVKQLGHEEPHLPGFQNFSNDQVFFLSYAHVCFWFRMIVPFMLYNIILYIKYAWFMPEFCCSFSGIIHFISFFFFSFGVAIRKKQQHCNKCLLMNIVLKYFESSEYCQTYLNSVKHTAVHKVVNWIHSSVARFGE